MRKRIVATRLYNYFKIEFKNLYKTGRTLRDGSTIFLFKNTPLDPNDFFDRTFILRKDYLLEPFSNISKFNIASAVDKSKAINSRISKTIIKRMTCSLPTR